MAKQDKLEQARREGMAYALKIAKEKGIDGLEDEVKFRNATFFPVAIKREACDECIEEIKRNVLDIMMVLSVATLRDEIKSFGQVRAQRYIDRLELKAECLTGDYCTWQDHIQMIKDEMGIELKIRMLEKD